MEAYQLRDKMAIAETNIQTLKQENEKLNEKLIKSIEDKKNYDLQIEKQIKELKNIKNILILSNDNNIIEQGNKIGRVEDGLLMKEVGDSQFDTRLTEITKQQQEKNVQIKTLEETLKSQETLIHTKDNQLKNLEDKNNELTNQIQIIEEKMNEIKILKDNKKIIRTRFNY